MTNNAIENWRTHQIIASKDDAQLLVDHNIFRPGADCDAAGAELRKDTDTYGRWQNEGNHRLLGWVAFTDSSSVDSNFFTEARNMYSPLQCGFLDFSCWNELYDEVVANAGAQP